MSFLRKIEQAGSEKGKPACLVKIVDCGEAVDKALDARKTGRGKKLKKSEREISSDDSSDGKGRVRHKSRVEDRRKQRKRRYSPSVTDSSDDSDSDSSWDSDSDSYSSSSERSSSKRRKRTSRKEKHKDRKRKRDRLRDKKQKTQNKRSRRKFKRSSGSSGTSNCDSASSDDVEKVTNKVKCPPPAANKPPEIFDARGLKNEERKVVEDLKIFHPTPHEEGELFEENGGAPENDNGLEYTTLPTHPHSPRTHTLIYWRSHRSRSKSRSPVNYSGRGRDRSVSPRRSCSPIDDRRRAVIDKLCSRLAPQGSNHLEESGRTRSRSRSNDDDDYDRRGKKGKGKVRSSSRSSRSCSPAGNTGLVSYGDLA